MMNENQAFIFCSAMLLISALLYLFGRAKKVEIMEAIGGISTAYFGVFSVGLGVMLLIKYN